MRRADRIGSVKPNPNPARKSRVESRGGVLLVLILVGALLLCDGAFGALHQVSALRDVPAGEHSAHASKGAAAPDEHQKDGQGSGHQRVHHAYAAVLFAILLWALIRLLNTAWSWGTLSASKSTGRGFLPAAFRLPRGPTAPVLQVFRL
jgi:hypothetical protein